MILLTDNWDPQRNSPQNILRKLFFPSLQVFILQNTKAPFQQTRKNYTWIIQGSKPLVKSWSSLKFRHFYYKSLLKVNTFTIASFVAAFQHGLFWIIFVLAYFQIQLRGYKTKFHSNIRLKNYVEFINMKNVFEHI